jgi:hypothetical protein
VSQPVNRRARVDLLEVIRLLFDHLTPALCTAVFRRHRVSERERKWTFAAVCQFWAAVVLEHPKALRHGLARTRQRGATAARWPQVDASPQAFFAKCQHMRPGLFQALFDAVTASLLGEAPRVYASWLAALREHFPGIVVVDGSRLDGIAHRLKALWPVRAVVLPGCLTACYDLFHGLVRGLVVYPDAAEAELPRVRPLLEGLAKGTLVLGDRLYGCLAFFHMLAEHDLHGLCRRHGRLSIRLKRRLSRVQGERRLLDDRLVEVGCGARQPKLVLRLIRCRMPGRRLDLLTDELDPSRLPAETAVALYGLRWTIERLFLDLKETLRLHTLYAAHPNLVAQQVYATALVYNAFRVAQARLAEKMHLIPEQFSPAKLFSDLAACMNVWAASQLTMMEVYRLNPGVRLNEPVWEDMPGASTELGALLVERRRGRRRHRRFCESRRKWTSFAHVPGGPTLLKSAGQPRLT